MKSFLRIRSFRLAAAVAVALAGLTTLVAEGVNQACRPDLSGLGRIEHRLHRDAACERRLHR
jgi:hypothetical protein